MATPNGTDVAFKRAAGRFASGITVVTTRVADEVYGITCSAFASLSLNPLLVTVSVNSFSPLLDRVRESGCFAVSVLARDQREVSQYFATRDRGGTRHAFAGIGSRSMETGAPVIDGCLSYFDCRLHDVLPGGDHRILVGNVAAAGGGHGAEPDGDTAPLLYYAGGYHELDPAAGDGRPAGLDGFTDSLSVQLHLLGLAPTDLIHAEAALEPMAAELAARRTDPGDLAALRATLDDARAAGQDTERFTAASVRFHHALGEASGNPAFSLAIGALRRVQHEHYGPNTNRARIERTIRAHEDIFAAISTGDPDRARAEMVRHLAAVQRGLRTRD